MSEELEIGDLFLIGEAVLGIDAHDLARVTQIPAAESALAAPFASFGGDDFYPDAAERAAILCSRLNRNHPFPDGNKRIALLAMLEQLHRAGLTWHGPGQDALGDVIESLAAGDFGEAEFIAYVQAHTS